MPTAFLIVLIIGIVALASVKVSRTFGVIVTLLAAVLLAFLFTRL